MLSSFHSKLHSHHQEIRGFTLIEIMIIAPIVILVIGALISVVVSMTGEVLAARSSNVLAYNIQDTLDRIQQDVQTSGAFLSTTNISPITSPQGSDNGTAAFKNVGGATGAALILNAYTTDKNPANSTRNTVYLTYPNSCSSSNSSQNAPLMVNVVYFVAGGTLWRRVVVPSNYTILGCSLPWQQSTCSPGLSGAICQSQDTQLVNGIVAGSGFTVNYYPTSTSTTPNTVAVDSGQSDANRLTAMQTTNTIGVTINATQTIAGRTVSQTGTIRVTGDNNNTAATNTSSSPVVTSQPLDKTVSSDTTNVTFTSASSGNGVTVQWQQSTNGGSTWTTIAGATSNTLTVPNADITMDGYLYKAIFTNSGGQATSSSAILNVTFKWYALTLQSGWVNYGGAWGTPAYTKTKDGMIVLRGLVKDGTATSGTVIATLPAGFRPSEKLLFENSTGNVLTGGRVDIDALGNIIFQIGTNGWYSLDGLNFMQSGTPFTNVSTVNGWNNYGGGFASAAYATDPSGRVHIKGLVGGGNAANGTAIITIPTALQPAYYEHIVNDSGNASGAIGINQTGGQIVAKGGSNAFLGLQALFYPGSYGGWIPLSLQNGWVAYGSPYSLPRYTKSADGLVMIKGLIRAGNTAATVVIANLPAGYCPKQQVLVTIDQVDVWGRVDVTAGSGWGCSLVVGQASSTSATWTSLDSVSYMADW